MIPSILNSNYFVNCLIIWGIGLGGFGSYIYFHEAHNITKLWKKAMLVTWFSILMISELLLLTLIVVDLPFASCLITLICSFVLAIVCFVGLDRLMNMFNKSNNFLYILFLSHIKAMEMIWIFTMFGFGGWIILGIAIYLFSSYIILGISILIFSVIAFYISLKNIL
jgi:hypothetical protein